MATLLKRYCYDGGMGTSDRSYIIGYCKEEPIEVLERLIQTHCIHSYKRSYCTPIDEVPANMDGIMILEYSNKDCNMFGLKVVKSISDYLNNEWMERNKWNKFSLEGFLKTIGETQVYYKHFDNDNWNKEVYHDIYNDFSHVYANLIKGDKENQPRIKQFMNICETYIKDEVILKNRGDKNRIITSEIESFNNIVIEKDYRIDVYCSEEKSRLYIKAIDNLGKWYSVEKDSVNVHVGRNLIKGDLLK